MRRTLETHARVLLRGGNRILTPVAAGLGVLAVAGAVLSDRLLGGEPGFGLDQSLLLAIGIALLGLGLLPAAAGPKLLAAGSVLASLLACELVLRVVSGGTASTIYRLDERYLHAHVAGASKTLVRSAANGGQRIRVSIDRDGFRGKELLPQGAARRVLVYGDSSIAAEFSSLEDTYVERLGAALARALGVPVEAVNAGVVAYGPDQIALRMQDELGVLAPELVIVAIFVHNDFGDLIRNKLFRVGEDGALVPRKFSIGPSLRLQDAYRKARDRSILYGMLQAAWSERPPNAQEEHAAPAAGRRDFAAAREPGLRRAREEYRDYLESDVVEKLFSDPYDYDVSLEPESESARAKVALLDAVIGRLGEIASAHSVPLLLLFIPSKLDVSELEGITPPDPAAYPHYDRRNLTALAVAGAARRGIPYLDLFDAFWQQRAQPLYFLADDDHWNDAGQALAAELTAERVLKEGWLTQRRITAGARAPPGGARSFACARSRPRRSRSSTASSCPAR